MKYLHQICLILLFSFAGELCRFLLPFPIPASIYGMVLLFAALALKLVRVEAVRETGNFLTSLLPVVFVAPIVNLMDCWDQIRGALLPLLLIAVLSTVIVFGAAGFVTQKLMHRKGGRDHD